MSINGTTELSRRTVIQALGSTAAVATVGGAASAAGNDEKIEYLCGVTNKYSVSDISGNVTQAAGMDAVEIYDENETLSFFHCGLPSASEDDVIAKIEEMEGVKYVEYNHVREPMATPDDPLFGDQFAPQLVNAPDAWDLTFGSEDVTIAIIDTGVDFTHPDLTSQFGSQKGRDFVDGDDDPSSGSAQHGTHVAGIASATTDDGTGIAGISNSRLLGLRVLGPNGGRTSDIANAVEFAVENGADIINMSLGGGGFNRTMKNAVSFAFDQGVLLICAAGNHEEGDPPSLQDVSFPAAYEECVAVAAVDSSGNTASFSNFGDEVDIAAPGQGVLSSVPGDDHAEFSGTSMASPVVAGVAALGLARNDWSVTQARQNLIETAQPLDEEARFVGAGLVDAFSFVTAGGGSENEPPTVTFAEDSRTVTVDQPVTFDASGSNDPDGEIANYRWEFGDGSDPVSGSDQTAVSHTYAETGEFTVTLTITDDEDAEASASVDVTVSEESTERVSRDGSGQLTGAGDRDGWTYSFNTDSPMQVTISLAGPDDADFDLAVSFDGRPPGPEDFDRKSFTQDSNEQIVVDSVQEVDQFGILVFSNAGAGEYTLRTEEIGQTS